MASNAPSRWQVFLVFLRLGSVSFGGPAMVAYIERVAVARRKWLSEGEFRQGVALCQAVPGATAMQCAAYVGLQARGLGGAVVAYVGFGLPAFLLMLALSAAYAHTADVGIVIAALTGLRVLVVALVAHATWTFARTAITGVRQGIFAAIAAALFFIEGDPFLIVAGAGLVGAIVLRGGSKPDVPPVTAPRPGWAALRAAGLVLGFAVILTVVLFGIDPRLAVLALSMMKVDVFAFGGGFASIPLMLHEIVSVHQWMPESVFMDGLALGQVTPGPIVVTATFAGCQVMGIAGALAATAGIFLPSLFAVVLAAPWFRLLQSAPPHCGATRALVLSFLGLLVSVTIRFAMVAPWSIPSSAIAGVALISLLLKVDILWVVLAGAAISAAVL